MVDLVLDRDYFRIDDLPSETAVIYLIGAVCGVIGRIILVLADLIWIFCFCRITRIDENEIRCGLLFPDIISSTEPITVGRAPLYVFQSKNGPIPRKTVIILASGDFDQTTLHKFGVAEIWAQSKRKHRSAKHDCRRPRKARENNLPERAIPERILWVKDSPGQLQALQTWLKNRSKTEVN